METKNQEANEKFAEALQLLWSMENRLIDSLPNLMNTATDFGLIKSLSHHFAETLQHRTALEGICKQLEIDPKEKPNHIFEDLLLENDRELEANKDDVGINALLIAGAVKVEEFEIASYATAIQYAKQLGLKAIQMRLLLTVEEERQSYNKLNFLLKNLSLTQSEIAEVTY